jgi:4-amino-4-deoxy-L-arabinose transferase-like glycosyltransferase
MRTRFAVVALLLLGFAVRMYALTSAPMGIGDDEMYHAFDAHRLIHEGNFQIYYPTNYGNEPLFIYAEAVTLTLFGSSAFTLRFTAVIGGMLMLAGAYALAARLFGRQAALITLALFASLFWPVFITRVGLRASTYPVFTIFGVYALWRTLEARSWRWALAAGVLNGLAVYTYIASRVFPAILIGWLLALALVDRTLLRRNGRRIALALGLAALIALPLLIYGLRYPDVVNQRPNTMGAPLNDLLRGDIASGVSGLVENTVKIAGMFTVRGDPDPRYNAEARPVFDLLTGLFFYVGLLIVVRRGLRPAYSLLCLWLLIGLTPTWLSDSAPAFLRAGGALFPILALPAIGVNGCVRWLEAGPRRIRVGGSWTGGLAVGGAAVLGALTLSVFLGTWRRSPESIKIYEGGLYLAARYLTENPPPEEVQLIGVAKFAHDNAPLIFRLHYPRSDRVRWSQAMVWPAGETGVWYLFMHDSIPDPQTRAWLGTAPAYVEYDSAGQVILEVYRLDHPPVTPPLANPVQAHFDQLADLIGVNYTPAWQRGQPANLDLFWRVRRDLAFDPSQFIRVDVSVIAQGITWTRGGVALLAYPPHHWRVGDIWVQRVALNIPADMPPQVVQPELALHLPTGAWPAIPAGADRARLSLPLPPVEIVGQPVSTAPPPDGAIRFGDALALVKSSLEIPAAGAQPGLSLITRTTWQALRELEQDYSVQLRLRAADGQERSLVTQAIYAGLYPTRRWRAGEIVTSVDALLIPGDSLSGEYLVQVRLLDAGRQPVGEWVNVASVAISGRPHVMAPPDVDVEVEALIGDVARLVGYRLDLDDAVRGGEVRVTLIWQAVQPSPRPLKVFTHLYGLQNTVHVYAQHDGEPVGGQLPTTIWFDGEYIEDVHIIPVDAAVPPGQYRLGVGMYEPETLQRLSVTANGQTSDFLILTQLQLP